MGRMRQHHGPGTLQDRTREQHIVLSGAPAIFQHVGKAPSLNSHQLKRLCSTLLLYFSTSEPDRSPTVCTLKQLQEGLFVRGTGQEMDEGALHVVMMALEGVGAVVRVGYGPDALYALNSHGFTSQILQCHLCAPANSCVAIAGPAEDGLAAAPYPEDHAPDAVRIIKRMVDVRVPLFQLDRSREKERLPVPPQRGTRSTKRASES